MTSSRQLKLGAVFTGAGGPGAHRAWVQDGIPADASVNIGWNLDYARRVEAAKFDYIFIVDSLFITPDSPPHYLNRLEPLTLLSAIAVHTQHVGLVATITTSYTDPFTVARQLASLDNISGGRAGWNIVTTGDSGTARNFSRTEHYDYETRHARAREHVAAARALWDSYEDDAFVRDTANGRFLDPDKQHKTNFAGTHFSIDGPLNLQRSPQGHPVIFQAGDSSDGRDLGGAVADAIFTHVASKEAAVAFAEDIRRRAVRAGRATNDVSIVPGVTVIIGDTDDEAREKERAIHELNRDFDKSLAQFGRSFGWHDFSQYDLDAPFPELGELGENSWKTRADSIKAFASENGLTLRETVDRFTAPAQSPFVGTAETVADTIQEWFEAGAIDGLNVMLGEPEEFDLIAERLIPLLQERDLFRREYTGTTLRENLGLPIPENVHSTRGAVSGAA